MKKYVVAVDVDDVLNNLNERAMEMFNINNGANLTPDMFTSYDIYKCLSFEDAEKYCTQWLNEDLWASLRPIKHSQWGLKKLIENGFEVILVTACHYKTFEWKMDWLKYYFPFVNEKNVICIHNKGLIKCDILIDDALHNLLAGSYHRVCLDHSWNRQYDRDTALYDEAHTIHRCYNWDEIIDTVEKIYEQDK